MIPTHACGYEIVIIITTTVSVDHTSKYIYNVHLYAYSYTTSSCSQPNGSWNGEKIPSRRRCTDDSYMHINYFILILFTLCFVYASI